MEGGIEVTERQARRCKHLLDDFKETRGFCKLKDEAQYNALCEELALEEVMDLL
jgi:hypothetical protein